jgi:phage major head subunit gpT-like protein
MSDDDQKTATMLHVNWRDSQAETVGIYPPRPDSVGRAMADELKSHPVFAAMRNIQDAVGKYTDPGYPMTADEFINVVLSAADDQEVVRAMKGTEDANRD